MGMRGFLRLNSDAGCIGSRTTPKQPLCRSRTNASIDHLAEKTIVFPRLWGYLVRVRHDMTHPERMLASDLRMPFASENYDPASKLLRLFGQKRSSRCRCSAWAPGASADLPLHGRSRLRLLDGSPRRLQSSKFGSLSWLDDGSLQQIPRLGHDDSRRRQICRCLSETPSPTPRHPLILPSA